MQYPHDLLCCKEFVSNQPHKYRGDHSSDGQGTEGRAPSLAGFTVAASGQITATGLRTALTLGNIPTHIVLNPSGSLLILLVPQPVGTGHMVSYAVTYDTGGNISRLTKRYDFTGLPGPFAGVFSPRAAASNQLLVVDENLPGTISFLVSASGTLTVNNSAGNRQRFPCWIVVTAAGTRAKLRPDEFACQAAQAVFDIANIA